MTIAEDESDLKKITFQCRNRDSEILSIVICVLLFLAGWMIASAIARSYGNNIFVTVAIPVAFLVCGVVYMSRRRNSAADGKGRAEFAGSGRVRLSFGGRSVIFDCRDVRSVSYARDTLTGNSVGNGYILTIKLPFRSYRIFSEETPYGSVEFEDCGLYELYRELSVRVNADERSE